MQVKAKEHAVRRIGIFSGTFDPVHIGHLRAAQVCLQALQLDKVFFAGQELFPKEA